MSPTPRRASPLPQAQNAPIFGKVLGAGTFQHMGYPVAYRQTPRPSHGFQGAKATPSGQVIAGPWAKDSPPGAKRYGDRNLPPNRNPYRPGAAKPDYKPQPKGAPPPAKFRPPEKPKAQPFGKKKPKPRISGMKYKIPGSYWWDIANFAYHQIANPQPSSFGWNVPEGSGWSPTLSCQPDQSQYDASQWAMTFENNVTTPICLQLQAFVYSPAGAYPNGDPNYDPGDFANQMIIWDQRRTNAERWATRQKFARADGSASRVPNFGPQGFTPPHVPQYTPNNAPRPGLYRPDPRPTPLRYAAQPRLDNEWQEGRSVGTPKPNPRGAIVWWPSFLTINRPGQPMPRPDPRTAPDPRWVPSMNTQIRANARGAQASKPSLGRHNLRPRRAERKVKIKDSGFAKITAAFGFVTEALDFINVTYYAIPKADRLAWMKANAQRYWSLKKQKWQYWMGPVEKSRAIKDMLSKVNQTQFLRNYAKNQIEDAIYGTLGKAQQSLYQRANSRGGNQVEGNAKYRDWERNMKKELGLDPDEQWKPTDLTDAAVDAILGDAPEGIF